MDNAKIGKFIAEMRKNAGLSQTELAKELNISNRTVSKWETGDGLPDIATVPQIAQFFGITVDELLAGERKPSVAQETAPKPATAVDTSTGADFVSKNIHRKCQRKSPFGQSGIIEKIAEMVRYSDFHLLIN